MADETPNKYWSGSTPDDCNLCGCIFGRVFSDARIPGHGWGLVCHPCAQAHRVQYGTGLGQQYRRQPDGRWLKVQG